MSHFTKCALKMTNLAALKKALADMQLKFTEAEQNQSVTVRGYRGDKLQAAISIDMGRYDVGVIDNQDGTYDITADWWGVETTKGVSEEEFKNTLSQKYQYLVQLRLEQAKRALAAGDRVTDFCFDVGFASLGTFSASFRKRTGLSPRDWQRTA